MIGPGTGIAPFRAFLQEHEYRQNSGKTWLFFGDRNKKYDYLYKEELATFVDLGVLTKLNVAFSRDQDEKVYVQDRMDEHGAELFKWLEEGAYVFVCGDAQHMAKDVHSTLCNIIKQYGNMSSAQASTYLENMKHENRYVLDVY
jgi:sulfite reductase (NADPH) flavoprotein alpha-component